MAKKRKRKRHATKKHNYVIGLLTFSIFVLCLYLLFHIGKMNLLKNAPSNAQEKEAVALGIDISKWQDDVDFQKVKMEGYSFVIVRSGYGMYDYEDEKFHDHVQGAKKAGLDVGAYHYSKATTIEEAKQEAEFFISMIQEYSWDLPVFYDIETDKQNHLSRNQLTEIALTFLTTLEDAGYKPGIYAAKSWYEDRLDMSQLEKYPIWIASYTNHLTYEGKFDFWQYTDQGEVDGVKGNCDINVMYN